MTTIRPAQAAKLTGLSAPYVYKLAQTGKLPSYKVGRAVLIDVVDLEKLIKQGRKA